MSAAYFYHVDEDGQTVRIRLLSQDQKRKVKVRVMRDWVSNLLLAFALLALMALGGTIDSWGNTQDDSTTQATNY